MKNVAIKFNIKFTGIIMLLCSIISVFSIIMVNFSYNKLGADNLHKQDITVYNDIMQINNQEKNVISSFITDYSKSPEERKFNIKLALKSLNNVVVKSGQEFSFNKVVGKRTEERGYKKALVIFKGRYEEGVGGGVCQVSSTLYNAWLLAGLDVIQVKAHTLPASYVDLSRDATVSEYIDLVLRNPLDSDITIKTEFNENEITIKILGKSKGYNYLLKTEILETIPYEEDIIMLDEVGNDEYFKGKDGYVSRLIITILKGDRTIAKKELRRDYYKPQNSVKILRKSALKV